MDAGILSIIISGFSLIASITSTIVVKHITLKHEEKMFALNFYYERKHTVIENYLKYVGGVIFYTDSSSIYKVADCLSEIYMYLPETYWKDIDEINKIVLDISNQYSDYPYFNKAKEKYLDFCKKVSKINRRMSLKETKTQIKKPE